MARWTQISFILSHKLERWASMRHERRRRKFGERVISELPLNLQKDIDWQAFRVPPGADGSER